MERDMNENRKVTTISKDQEEQMLHTTFVVKIEIHYSSRWNGREKETKAIAKSQKKLIISSSTAPSALVPT